MPDDKGRQPASISGLFMTTALIAGLSLVTAYLTGMIETLRFDSILTSVQSVLMMVVGIAIGYFVQIFVHEFGHLLSGIISGYSFISFRTGRMMFSKQDGKIKRTRLSIPGTLGQCLMAPPAPREGVYPYKLYNIGGGAANILVGLLLLAMMMLVPWPPFMRPIGFGLITVGLYMGISNLVPAGMQGIRNDGANVRALQSDGIVRQGFWAILQISANLVAGKRMREISSGLFAIPVAANKADPIICNWGALQVGFYEDWHDFGSANRLAREWFEAEGMPEMLKLELLSMMAFYELIGECNPNELRRLYSTQLQQHPIGFQQSLSRLRLDYAFELLFNHDAETAQRYLQQFEQVAVHYPYQGEVQSERELLALVDDLAARRQLPADPGSEASSDSVPSDAESSGTDEV